MLSRWNSQILPRAETATSHVAFSEEFNALRSFNKLLSSDNITEKHTKKTRNKFYQQIIDNTMEE